MDVDEIDDSDAEDTEEERELFKEVKLFEGLSLEEVSLRKKQIQRETIKSVELEF